MLKKKPWRKKFCQENEKERKIIKNSKINLISLIKLNFKKPSLTYKVGNFSYLNMISME